MCRMSRMLHKFSLAAGEDAEKAPYIIGATGMEAIRQNLRVILTTLAFSVALDRAFAHDGRMIDSPAPNETARLTVELVDAIERYEPRIRVERLEFVYSGRNSQLMEGKLAPSITFSIREGVEI